MTSDTLCAAGACSLSQPATIQASEWNPDDEYLTRLTICDNPALQVLSCASSHGVDIHREMHHKRTLSKLVSNKHANVELVHLRGLVALVLAAAFDGFTMLIQHTGPVTRL